MISSSAQRLRIGMIASIISCALSVSVAGIRPAIDSQRSGLLREKKFKK